MSRRLGSLAFAALLGAALCTLAACSHESDHGPLEVPSTADAAAGARLIESNGCATCHRIPGIPGANGRVGPSLDGFAQQLYLAGEVPNTFANLVQWIQDPQSIEPATIMPSFGLHEDEAADVAAYLATLR